MALRTSALLSAGFLVLICGTLADKDEGSGFLSVKVSVENEQFNEPPKPYSSTVVKGGVLLALRRLRDAQHSFKFTVKEDANFGRFLEGVNEVAGNKDEKTHWESLPEGSGDFDRLNVGIICATPKANDHIIQRYTTQNSSTVMHVEEQLFRNRFGRKSVPNCTLVMHVVTKQQHLLVISSNVIY